MSKKVLNMIEFFYLIIIGFVGFCLYQNIPSTIFWLSVGVGIFTFILLNILYNNILKMITINRKKVICFYLLFFVTNGVLFLVLNNNIWKTNLLLFLIQILSCVFFSLFIRKEQDKPKWIFSLILLSIFNIISFVHLNQNTILISFVTNFALYLTTLFDDLAIYRKKNYIFMFIMGLLLSIVFQVSKLAIINIFFLLFIVSRKRGIKSAIKLSPSMLIGFFILLPVNIDYLSPITEIQNNLSIATTLIFILISVIGTLYSFYHQERKMGYLCRGFMILCIVMSIILNSNEFEMLQTLMAIILLLILTIYENIPMVYQHKVSIQKKWIKAQQKGTKKVSVVVPNYNYEHYIIERIDSILNQSYKISELIILDDCSKDNSVEVIKKKIQEIEKVYPSLPLKFIPNKKNSGNVFAQWKKCFEVASGDYLWICEADDSAHPKFLENVMKSFDNPDVILSYAESLTMDENNNLLMPNLREWIDIFHCDKWNKSYVKTGKEELESTLCINNTIANASSVVFKLKEEIPYQEYLTEAQSFKLAGDWHFYAKVLEHGSVAYHHKSLNYHRMHSKSVTLTTKGDLNYLEVVRIQDMISKTHHLEKEVLEKIDTYRQMLKKRFHLGEEELRLLEIPFEEIWKQSKVKDDILLSIIIPVYNTEKFLKKCIDSVLLKIPPKTEIIIVNDGSPDNSKKIIEEYEKNYPNIIFGIHKKNGGLSSAKNYGLKKARGRYLIYLDSDDYVAPNMYMTMLKKALETNADIVYCDMIEEFDNGEKIFFSMKNYERKEEFLQFIDNPLMATSCNKLVKKELFEGLEYPEKTNNEDIAVNPVLFEKAKIIKHVDSPFYYYYQRSGSIQNSTFNEKRFVIFKAIKICFEHLEKINATHIEEIKGSVYTHQIIGLLIFVICKQPKKERMKYYNLFCDYMKEFEDFETNPYVKEYLELYHLKELTNLIKKKSIKKLDLYLQIKMQ